MVDGDGNPVYPIDVSGDSSFSIRMDTMSQFTTMTIEPDDETNLAVTNYTISFSTSIPVLNNDVMYITFPSELSLPSTVECEESTGFTTVTCTHTD